MAPARGSSSPVPLAEDTRDPQGMAAHLDRHLEWMATANYAPDSLRNARGYVSRFVAWCEERGIVRPADLTRRHVERYQRSLHLYHNERDGRALSVPTQLAHLYAIRQYLKWLARSNLILYNPAAEVDLPRCERRLPRHVMSAQEAEQVLAQPDLRTPLGLRDRAILETLYSTALRRKELVQLSVPDLELERGTVMVRLGKGHRDRVVPIGERAAAWLTRYLEEVRPGHVQDPAEAAVFLTRVGRRITVDSMSQLVSGYVRASGIGKAGACHAFRHAAATAMLENGADVRFIQELLGHQSLATTQVYTKVSIRKLQEVHARTHPGRLFRTDATTAGAGGTGQGEASEPFPSSSSSPAASPLAAEKKDSDST